MQRLGPNAPAIAKDLQEIDQVCQGLIEFYEAQQTSVIVLSEYGITSVNQPISLNRVLREAGYITVREELGLELLDAGASSAFAVADHQIAHIYVNDPDKISAVRKLIEQVPGVASVLGDEEKKELGLNHARSGELIAIAEPNAWFTYYYWLDDKKAPDFARTVDIHRKPGYDPVELFIDPQIPVSFLKLGWILLKKQLGFRTLFDVISLDASLVKGSHGCMPTTQEESPLFISQQLESLPDKSHLEATEIHDIILAHLKAK